MKKALPFPGVFEFLSYCKHVQIAVYVVSHKTKFPYKGMQYNLHQSALTWMFQQGFMCEDKYGLSEERVFFEATTTEKCERIRSLRCNVFLDDLPEFLLSEKFPSFAKRIMFDPHNQMKVSSGLRRVGSWEEFRESLSRKWEKQCIATA